MFEQRSYQKELLDATEIPREQLHQNLAELEVINKYLGGHSATLSGMQQVLTDKSKYYHIVDIGCGGGDSINAIAEWSEREGFNTFLTGIDLKQDCIFYALNNCKDHSDIGFRCDDFRNSFSNEARVDIVHASLFCHHFHEDDLTDFVKDCSNNGAVFIVNDLVRSPLAYYAIKLLTKLFSLSPLVKNDAPLSVLRGFTTNEWETILQRAGIKKYVIKNQWAFRLLVIAYPNE